MYIYIYALDAHLSSVVVVGWALATVVLGKQTGSCKSETHPPYKLQEIHRTVCVKYDSLIYIVACGYEI